MPCQSAPLASPARDGKDVLEDPGGYRYLEGLSSGDFEPAFRELLGEHAPLSPSTILRLKEEWAAEYAAWRVRPLSARYAYIWSDGIYLGAGLEPEHSCLLVVGAREDGRKELLAMELGYPREQRFLGRNAARAA